MNLPAMVSSSSGWLSVVSLGGTTYQAGMESCFCSVCPGLVKWQYSPVLDCQTKTTTETNSKPIPGNLNLTSNWRSVPCAACHIWLRHAGQSMMEAIIGHLEDGVIFNGLPMVAPQSGRACIAFACVARRASSAISYLIQHGCMLPWSLGALEITIFNCLGDRGNLVLQFVYLRVRLSKETGKCLRSEIKICDKTSVESFSMVFSFGMELHISIIVKLMFQNPGLEENWKYVIWQSWPWMRRE